MLRLKLLWVENIKDCNNSSQHTCTGKTKYQEYKVQSILYKFILFLMVFFLIKIINR